MASVDPPREPATSGDLLNHPLVQQALEQAWSDSLPDDPMRRHEEGGWIYMDLRTGKVSIRRAPMGSQAELDISNPPLVSGSTIVGIFHTHPSPSAEGWDVGPSVEDIIIHDDLGLPGLIRAEDGIHAFGPTCRRGGLAGGPGYPAELQ
jgi:hypothetical protein